MRVLRLRAMATFCCRAPRAHVNAPRTDVETHVICGGSGGSEKSNFFIFRDWNIGQSGNLKTNRFFLFACA